MFEKFGEMSSYTEINELAANLLQEGDIDSLKELAKENGIPDDYVEHGNVDLLRREVGLDAETIVKQIIADYVTIGKD